MKRFFIIFCILGIVSVTLGGCHHHTKSELENSRQTDRTAAPSSSPSPTTDEEMRGVWLSYIELNTMFSGKSQSEAKAALNTTMDNIRSYGLNTVIFHVRANSDAYYSSSLFEAADSVKPLLAEGFDPLAYAIESAHSRGLKLQAWINPYRVGSKPAFAKCADMFFMNDRYYYNPASLEVQSLILRGVSEVVSNYEIDGVQFDDYFYPSNDTEIPSSSPASFENEAYTAYKDNGGLLSVADWRRTHVGALIASSYQKVHTRTGCVFGISPRASVSDSYSLLYADIEEWISHPGYVDYICPQIYYGFENSTAPFDKTVAAWVVMKRNASVKLYIGLGLYKTGWESDGYAGKGIGEWSTHDDIIKRSVELIRSQKSCGGILFYSYSSFDAHIREVEYSQDIAQKEIENLLSILSASAS